MLLAASVLAAVFSLAPAGGASSQAVTNGRIAFTSDPDASAATDIYTVDPDGSNVAGPLTSPYTDSQPSFSPDGTMIAWSTFEFATSPCCQSIGVMNADGSDRARVISGEDTKSGINNSPTWSPDERQLAFVSNFGGLTAQIGTVGIDGRGLAQLTSGSVDSVDPSWSPDGTKIAFDRQAGGRFAIYTMNVDGTDVEQLAAAATDDLVDPAWSPDGTKIAYTSTTPNGYEIFVMNADGTKRTQLTTDGGEQPNWSPDGTKIVFTTQRDRDYEIYTMNVDGTTQTRVTNSPGVDQQPTWGRVPARGGGADDTAPIVTVALDSPNGGAPNGSAGWFTSGPVTGTVSADDSATGGSALSALSCGSLALTESGVDTPSASGTFSIAAEGVTHISCTATDSAGNTSAPATTDVPLDTVAPGVSLDPAANSCSSPVVDGRCTGTQTAGFTAGDATSGTATPCAAIGGSACTFTQASSTQGPAVTIRIRAGMRRGRQLRSGIAAGPFTIGPANPSTATLHLEVIARGRPELPAPSAVFRVTSSADSLPIEVGIHALTGANGQPCPGVGPLCTADIHVPVGASPAAVLIETVVRPPGQVPVYSGDCDGGGSGAHTSGFVSRLSVGQTATCRITFVNPDAGGSSNDSALLVTKDFEPEPLIVGHPDGQLVLGGTSPSALATTSLRSLRDASSPDQACPLRADHPVCEWAVTLDGDDLAGGRRPRLTETTAAKWIGIFSGDCNAAGTVVADSTPHGDLFECLIRNIHLEAQSDSHPNSVLRVTVDAPTDTSRPPKDADIVVADSAGGSRPTSMSPGGWSTRTARTAPVWVRRPAPATPASSSTRRASATRTTSSSEFAPRRPATR